ncbi:HAD hydrolase family protein [Jidongwangia harbinensis]|uniref:HAD hydrolase family protein n=1 Tax=Jidongwangia harbinensis TaxID=2878561 RepID=UPI001CDA3F7E|nr:HAD hydrolase family protein [Jidongwangia harbinensis]MCA2211320.1 HAD hydrolase family protein [Jidongwangia harbinensis]
MVPERDTTPFLPGGQLVACDLDGTLLRDDGTVSPATRRTLDRLAAAGIGFLVVTGRPVRTLPAALRYLRAPGLVVCVNGAACYDPDADRVLARAAVAPAALAEAVDRLRHLFPDVVFAAEVDGGRWLMYEPAYPLDPRTPWSRRIGLTALIRRPVCKFLAKVRDEDPDDLLAAVGTALDGVVEVGTTRCPGVLEMTGAGVTKAAAVSRLAAAAGIPAARVTAFGDMPCDLSMMEWSGAGVAVANAHPAVLARITTVTSSNQDDGVARYLDRMLAGPAPEPVRRSG